ncbi:MAG: carbamoyltransferase C-terminal domain-containing protein [Pseudomonadota bacterium]
MSSGRHICVGIHIGHDRSVSIVEEGTLVAHLAEERIDRVKHSPSVAFPRRSLDVLLRSVGCTLQDVSAFGLTYAFVNMEKLGESLAEDFRAEFGLPNATVFPMGHHLAHAYSAFFTSPFAEATVVVADGAGDLVDEQLEAETAYRASPTGLAQIWSRRQDIPSSYAERRNFFRLPYMPDFDHLKQISIARKYEQFTYALDFGWGQSGKTMGLAAYGTPLFSPPEHAFMPPLFCLSMTDMLAELEVLKNHSGMAFGEFMRENRHDIAATVQSAAERIMISICRHLYKLSPSENLCLAGGLFLNCVLNHKLINETGFSNIHIVPACGDDGQSIGAAYFACERIGGRPVPFAASPYQGPAYSEQEVFAAIEAAGVGEKAKRFANDELIRALVDRLKDNRTVGLFRGRSEMGPRALGHRSILANSGARSMRDHLNRYVKHREDFRPLAPIVRWEDQFDIFDLAAPSPHMLMTASVRPEWREKLAAVTHVDNSARVQAVRQSDEPFLHSLLTAEDRATGVPVLLNTSFNLRGEPIVETPADALATFHRSNLDSVVIENVLIDRD